MNLVRGLALRRYTTEEGICQSLAGQLHKLGTSRKLPGLDPSSLVGSAHPSEAQHEQAFRSYCIAISGSRVNLFPSDPSSLYPDFLLCEDEESDSQMLAD